MRPLKAGSKRSFEACVGVKSTLFHGNSVKNEVKNNKNRSYVADVPTERQESAAFCINPSFRKINTQNNT